MSDFWLRCKRRDLATHHVIQAAFWITSKIDGEF